MVTRARGFHVEYKGFAALVRTTKPWGTRPARGRPVPAQLWPSQVGSWSEVAQTTIKWRRNGRRFVHTTARPYHPPFRPFRRHPNAVHSLLKPVETAGGC